MSRLSLVLRAARSVNDAGHRVLKQRCVEKTSVRVTDLTRIERDAVSFTHLTSQPLGRWAGSQSTRMAPAGCARAGWLTRPARSPGHGCGWPPVSLVSAPQTSSPATQAAENLGGHRAGYQRRCQRWFGNTARWWGFRRRYRLRGPRPTILADTGRGQSGRACAVLRVDGFH